VPRLDGAGGVRERYAVSRESDPHRRVEIVENEIRW
jgi:hypothetical protein